MRKALLAFAVLPLGLFGAGACHNAVRDELPTAPAATPAPLIPVAPVGGAPQPTPRPAPVNPGNSPTAPGASPSPNEDPLPALPGGEGGSGGSGGSGSCGGPISKIDVKVHIFGAARTTLDASPLVGPSEAFCRSIGFTDGRKYCPPRAEGHPERGSCDAELMGQASDTGRTGPTWRVNGKACAFANGCENHPDNQFLVFAYLPATYQACSSSGVCGAFALAP